MSQAVVCPVCDGTGRVCEQGLTDTTASKVCHGCGGKGWVELTGNPYRPARPLPWSVWTRTIH